MHNTLLLTLTAYVFFFLSGFFINIGGAVTNSLATALGTTTAVTGLSFTAFMIGRVAGISGNGHVLRKKSFPKGLYLRLAAGLFCALSAGFLITGHIAAFTVLIFIAGILVGVVYSASNMILVDLYCGPQKAFHISMINFLYSVGGVTSPFLTGLILKQGHAWNRPYLMPAAVVCVFLLVTIRARYSDLYSLNTEGGPTHTDSGTIDAPLWMVSAAIVCFIMAEYSITYWTPVYLREALNKDVLFAGSAVSTFWIAVLIGRFLQSMLISRIRPRLYIISSGILAILSLLALRQLTDNRLIAVGIFVCGLFCSGLFPALFIFGSDRAEHIKHRFPTLMMLSAAAGSFLAMPAGSLIKNVAGVQAVMLTPAVAIGIMTILIIVSGRGSRRRSR